MEDICVCNYPRKKHENMSLNHLFELKYVATNKDKCGACSLSRSNHNNVKHMFVFDKIQNECQIC